MTAPRKNGIACGSISLLNCMMTVGSIYIFIIVQFVAMPLDMAAQRYEDFFFRATFIITFLGSTDYGGHSTCLFLRAGEDFLRIGASTFAYRRKVFCV